jgi:hypothetical protein
MYVPIDTTYCRNMWIIFWSKVGALLCMFGNTGESDVPKEKSDESAHQELT